MIQIIKNISDSQRLKFMWDNDKTCFWCKNETSFDCMINGILFWNTATKDHLYSKIDKRRYSTKRNGRSLVVLSCNFCNQKRDNKSPEKFSRIMKTKINFDKVYY